MHQGLTGEEINGYRLLKRLSESDLSDIYLAEYAGRPGNRQQFAFKIVHNKADSDPHFVQRFMREMRILEEVEHPHILPVLDWGISPGELPYTVTGYIEDLKTLAEVLAQNTLSPRDTWRILGPVCDVLGELHAENILHRDLRPEKVYVLQTPEGYHSYMGNLGMSKQVGVDLTVTDRSRPLTTPGYTPPEAARGEEFEPRSDIYNIALLAYEMLIGQPPFTHNQPHMRLILAHGRDPAPPLHEVNPDFPAGLEAVVLRSLAKQADDRHPSAQAFADDFQAALEALSDEAATRHYWV